MKTKKTYLLIVFVLFIIVVSVFIYLNVSYKGESHMRGTFVFHNERIEKGYAL